MFLVDTNVFVYAADRRAPEHEACRRHVETWRARALPWYTTWGVIYEFLRVITHPRVLREPWSLEQGLGFVEALLVSPTLSVLSPTDAHAELLAETVGELPELRGNVVHDLHTAVLAREHGLSRVVTRDTDFHRFPFLEVLDPLRMG